MKFEQNVEWIGKYAESGWSVLQHGYSVKLKLTFFGLLLRVFVLIALNYRKTTNILMNVKMINLL